MPVLIASMMLLLVSLINYLMLLFNVVIYCCYYLMLLLFNFIAMEIYLHACIDCLNDVIVGFLINYFY